MATKTWLGRLLLLPRGFLLEPKVVRADARKHHSSLIIENRRVHKPRVLGVQWPLQVTKKGAVAREHERPLTIERVVDAYGIAGRGINTP
jgi:hypothetical protein